MKQSTLPVVQMDQARRRKRCSAEGWRKLLVDQQASGLTISAFCRERGIAAASLFAWRRRLAGAEPMFKPVTIAATPTPAHCGGDDGGDAAIELRLPGERRLIVRRGFDRQLLVDVMRALESLA